jgi:hypothetical protein
VSRKGGSNLQPSEWQSIDGLGHVRPARTWHAGCDDIKAKALLAIDRGSCLSSRPFQQDVRGQDAQDALHHAVPCGELSGAAVLGLGWLPAAVHSRQQSYDVSKPPMRQLRARLCKPIDQFISWRMNLRSCLHSSGEHDCLHKVCISSRPSSIRWWCFDCCQSARGSGHTAYPVLTFALVSPSSFET